MEVSRELGSPFGFLVEYRWESVNTPVVFRVRENDDKKHRTQTRYRQAKETKRGEMSRRVSECLDSTDEVGELHPGGVDGGKRGIGILNHCWET